MNKTLSSCLQELKNKLKEEFSCVIQKVVGVADRSSRLGEVFIKSLSHSSNRVPQRKSLLELVAYENVRKESCDSSTITAFLAMGVDLLSTMKCCKVTMWQQRSNASIRQQDMISHL